MTMSEGNQGAPGNTDRRARNRGLSTSEESEMNHRRNTFLPRGAVLALIVSLVLVVTACSSCGTSSFSPELQGKIEKALEATMSESGIPGAVIGVWLPGEGAWTRAIGDADIKTRREVKPADNFRIGSITKTFTATVILQLVDEGKIGLDDTLDKYVPDVPNAGDITIRELCNMTSGLFDYTGDEDFQNALDEDPARKWEPSELVEFATSHDPLFAPGDGWEYCNTNYILLGMIIEQVTGNEIGGEIQSRIIDRLGLENTSFPDNRDMTGEYSHGYMADEENGKLEDITSTFDPSLAWAAGAMISNLDDLETWARAVAGGDLLSEETQKERLSWVDAEMGGLDFQYGLGIGHVEGFVGHGGDVPGYSSALFHDTEKDATVVVLLNKNPNEEDATGIRLFIDIAEALFPGGAQGS